jgi:REP element-mobilizing transposase RayT
MASTFLSLHYHFIFSTRDRYPFIQKQWKQRLHECLGSTVNKLGGFHQGIGGAADHVHLLVGLKATHCLAHFIGELKKTTSIWVHQDLKLETFAWQEGYSAFTVSPSARKGVKAYIANQVQHHRVKTFREELLELLKRAGVKYDEKFLD